MSTNAWTVLIVIFCLYYLWPKKKQVRRYKCNSCQWTGTKLNNLSQCPHCTSDNISSN